MRDIRDYTFNSSNIETEVLCSGWDKKEEVNVDIRKKSHKFYLCYSWETSGDFEIILRFKNFNKVKRFFNKKVNRV